MALKAGGASWQEFSASAGGRPIDLRLGDLAGRNLSDTTFVGCDMSGADLSGANLDGATLVGCTLDRATLDNSSLIGVRLEDTDLTGAILDHAVFRKVLFSNVTLTGCSLLRTRIQLSSFCNCIIADLTDACGFQIVGSEVRSCRLQRLSLESEFLFEDVRFIDCEVTDVASIGGAIVRVRVDGSTVSRLSVRTCNLDGLTVSSSEVTQLFLENSSVSEIRFMSSTLDRCVLGGLDLASAAFVGCSMVRCEWPPQSPTISFGGKLTSAPSLLGQPVQDIAGLPPRLRREIADAQYLRDLHRDASGLSARVLLRLWGASSNFGQSVARLTAWTAGLVSVLCMTLPLADGKTSSLRDAPAALWRAARSVTASFFGQTIDAAANYKGTQSVLLFAARISGFVVLGLWVGIAANRLGRLSSE